MNYQITFILAVLLVCIATISPAATVQIRVAVDGNDENDGLSWALPVATLRTGIVKALAQLKAGENQVEVQVGPGIYQRQHAEIPALPTGKTLRLLGVQGQTVFDGAGEGGLWLLVRGGGIRSGMLHIAGFKIVNYQMALNLAGNRVKMDRSVNNVSIRNNEFNNIGQIALLEGKPSTAVIRLVNSDHNTIVNNSFAHIQNKQRCRLLHAIYIAHGSTDNHIEGNRFTDSCGNPVHFRDRSSNNLVKKNIFQDAWADALISDWYCNSELRADCTKIIAECPSYDNLVEGNLMLTVERKAVSLTLAFGVNITVTCPAQGSGRRFVCK